MVAVAAAAVSFHHDLSENHLGSGLLDYAMVFFAIWWAWVNYSWFASAYDTGDVVFRLATFGVMTGVLIFAAGIPAITGPDQDFTLGVIGYAVMRLALVPMWLRVSRDHPEGRAAALRYAVGVTGVQALWIGRLWVEDDTLALVTFAALVVLEMSIPWWAEHSDRRTPWHPDHIVERYQLFTIIVLGEVILATTQAISATLDLEEAGFDLLMLVLGALLIVFSLWWLYFKRSMASCLSEDSAFVFGYAHYFVLGAVAAVGAALAACVDLVQHEAHGLEPRTAALILAATVAVYLVSLGAIHGFGGRTPGDLLAPAFVSLALVAAAFLGTAVSDQIGLSVLLLGIVLTLAVVDHQLRNRVPTAT